MINHLIGKRNIDPEIEEITTEYITRDVFSIIEILSADCTEDERADALEFAVSAILHKLEKSEYIEPVPQDLKEYVVSNFAKVLIGSTAAVAKEVASE
ncbi:hypothetical protein [Paenibacillus dendritiformis]|uniref:hypothetical protein n=1 Tax=Paenibacillus dendritiformis TaxID=130049 RepID=UPI00387E1757